MRVGRCKHTTSSSSNKSGSYKNLDKHGHKIILPNTGHSSDSNRQGDKRNSQGSKWGKRGNYRFHSDYIWDSDHLDKNFKNKKRKYKYKEIKEGLNDYLEFKNVPYSEDYLDIGDFLGHFDSKYFIDNNKAKVYDLLNNNVRGVEIGDFGIIAINGGDDVAFENKNDEFLLSELDINKMISIEGNGLEINEYTRIYIRNYKGHIIGNMDLKTLFTYIPMEKKDYRASLNFFMEKYSINEKEFNLDDNRIPKGMKIKENPVYNNNPKKKIKIRTGRRNPTAFKKSA